MDNPPERYSPWISTGRFGGSVIHRYSLVDDVDIHHQIYQHARGCRGSRKPFKGSDVHIVFQHNNIYWLRLPIFLQEHLLWCSNTLRVSFLHDAFPWQQVFFSKHISKVFWLQINGLAYIKWLALEIIYGYRAVIIFFIQLFAVWLLLALICIEL